MTAAPQGEPRRQRQGDAAVDPGVVAGNLLRLRRIIDDLGGARARIIAVTKGFGPEAVQAVMDAGCRDVGENYAQEVVAKFGPMEPERRPEIHLIGQLQSNKVAALAPLVSVWQTVDRPSIAGAIARRRPGARVLVQVDATDEAGKGGCRLSDTPALVSESRALGLEVVGLMTIGPTDGDRERTKLAFATVAALRSVLGLAELSMGMSNDLDIAVPLGATMVRIGRAIFGERPPKNPNWPLI
ncbi:MAG: YggS family pyridoxal phosphate-dependent enzyme [Actinomycetota bacterium]